MNKHGSSNVAQGDDAVESIKDTVKGLVDQGAQKVDAIRNKVVEAKDQAMNRGSEGLDRLASMVRAHPLKAVGIAFAMGYIGMRLFRR